MIKMQGGRVTGKERKGKGNGDDDADADEADELEACVATKDLGRS